MKSRMAVSSLLVAISVPLLSCGAGHTGENYVLISTNIKVPYWQSSAAGFAQSAEQLKVGYAFQGPSTYDPGAERDAVESAIQKKPSGILISVADSNLLTDSIDRAIQA